MRTQSTFFFAAISLVGIATIPIAAQWLNQPTPGIPRTHEGKPNLAAASPRTADGKPDLTGVWISPSRPLRPAPTDVQPWASEVARQRAEDFFKSRPVFRCLPSGPEGTGYPVWKRIVQTSNVIALLNDDLTYRQIFMDGRTLEANPFPSWMGYSVGRWDEDTLVVDSFGFNDRTWLTPYGHPHTEALRMTERYRRVDVGHLRVDVIFTDPTAYTRPLALSVNMELAVDTEMMERVCERTSDQWIGTAADTRQSRVTVAPDILARYVGVYSGFWADRPRRVDVRASNGTLAVVLDDEQEEIPLMPRAEKLFESSEGLGYRFVTDLSGPATDVFEIHVSGDYKYARRR